MSDETTRAGSTPPVDRLSLLWRRVHEHKVVQWTVGYVAVSYGIQHAVTLTTEALDWPHIITRISIILLALGLPLAMTLAWYHGERASHRISGGEAAIVSLLLVLICFAFYAIVRPTPDRVASSATPVPHATLTAARNAAASPKSAFSLAVLPFLDLSQAKDQEYFSDGMTEEITTALAKVPDLRVVGRTSAFQFKGRAEDMRDMGRALGATHLLEGSVRKAGDRVRITAQLIRADSGLHLWTQNYDRQLTDVFAIQEDIAQAIVGALRVPLGLQQGQQLVSNRSIDPQAYQQYLRAKALVRGRGTARGIKPLSDAATLLEQLIRRDPDYPPAWALLAEAYATLPDYSGAFYNGDIDEQRSIVAASLPKAAAAARRAVALDPNSADGYLNLGFVQAVQFKWVAAEELYVRALSLDPNNSDGLHRYGNLLAAVGRLRDSLAVRKRLLELEPFVPTFSANTAAVLWLSGQNDAATTLLKAVPETYRPFYLARIYAADDRFSSAADELLKLVPSATFRSQTVQNAIRVLRTAPTVAKLPDSFPPLGGLDFVYLYVGAPQRAVEFHEDNLNTGYSDALSIALLWHPSYGAMRKTEQFKNYVRAAGMLDYWRAKAWPDLCHPTTGDDFECS